MQYHVTFEAYDTIIGKDVPGLRAFVGGWLQRLLESGKVVSQGIFVGKRGGFIVLNADSNEEAFTLIGDVVDYMKITVMPIVSAQFLGEHFQKNQPT